MYKIIENANNSNESKISSTIQINKIEDEWKQDEISKEYVSKIFQVTAGANVKDCKIQIIKENGTDVNEIKITDLENQEKNQFMINEEFKVLLPIKNMQKAGSFKIIVEGNVQTKPILYGKAPNSGWQDYALTAATYEEGSGEKTEEYPENETQIIIVKEDGKTKERLENTEFELLDENNKLIYSDLKTNQEGKIEIKHLIPGKYYLKETKAKEGYELYEELMEIQLTLHEQYTITMNNNKQEKPKIESKKIGGRKILPVTGM